MTKEISDLENALAEWNKEMVGYGRALNNSEDLYNVAESLLKALKAAHLGEVRAGGDGTFTIFRMKFNPELHLRKGNLFFIPIGEVE